MNIHQHCQSICNAWHERIKETGMTVRDFRISTGYCPFIFYGTPIHEVDAIERAVTRFEQIIYNH